MHNDEKTLVFAQSSQFLRTVLFVSCLTFQLTARANKSRLKTDKLIPNSMSGHSSFCLLSTSQHSPHAWTRTSDNKNHKECRKRILSFLNLLLAECHKQIKLVLLYQVVKF